jgi:Polyketide cyclase / dehydrase and lipid transport
VAPVRSESRGEVAAGIEAVYAYVSDVARWPEWAHAIRECSVSGGGPLRAGARIDQRVSGSGGSPKERTLDVTTVDVPHRIEFAGSYGPSPLRWGFGLTAAGERRTAILLWVEMDRRGPMRATPAPVLRKMVRATNDREIAAIKTAVEAGITPKGAEPAG